MSNGAVGALICMRKSSRRPAFGTVTRAAKAPGTHQGFSRQKTEATPYTGQ